MEKIGNIIKELREAKEISQPKLAKEIGVANSVISNWENNLNIPRGDYIAKLAIYFGVTSDYILGLETEDGRKIIDLTENRPEGEELLTFPAAARSKGNKIRGGVMLKLTREQLDEIYRQNGKDPNKE